MHVHDIPDPAAQEAIHRLWDELADFEVGRTEAAVHHLKTALCGMVDAWNATWAGAMRLGDGKDGDPLQGWRVTTTRVLHPFESDPQGPFEELQERFSVPPGITGLWQVEARDNPSFSAYRRLDLFYVENWSITLDLAILFETASSVISRIFRGLR